MEIDDLVDMVSDDLFCPWLPENESYQILLSILEGGHSSFAIGVDSLSMSAGAFLQNLPISNLLKLSASVLSLPGTCPAKLFYYLSAH